MDAYERDREANAVGPGDDLVFEDVLDDDYWPEEWIEDDDLDIDEEIAKAKRVVERALFTSQGRSFLTARRSA